MKNVIWIFLGLGCFVAVIDSCNPGSSSHTTTTYNSSPTPAPHPVTPPRNDYEDMRARGHSEEDAVIFSILKQQGFSDYDAINAMQSSKER